MSHSRIFIFLFCLLSSLTVISDGCKKDSILSPDNPDSLSFNYRIRGTWRTAFDQEDSTYISFDASSSRFIDQYGYDFGIRREFPGSYFLSETKLEMRYDYGVKDTYWYNFDGQFLILGDSLFKGTRKYLQVSIFPSPNGWSKKLSIIHEDLYSYYGSISGVGNTDLGTVVLISNYGDSLEYLLMINRNTNKITIDTLRGIRAIDATGTNIWLVTDSTVVKRNIVDSSMTTVFSFRPKINKDFRVTGFTVNQSYCYLMTNKPNGYYGMLFQLSINGNILDSIRTNPVIKDMCLEGDRLFCILGDETFVELNKNGKVISNYNLLNRPFGNNLEGIMTKNGVMQLVGSDSHGRLRLSDVEIPF